MPGARRRYCSLRCVQHRGDLVDLIERALAAGERVGNAFAQDVAERAVEGVGREQVGDRAGEHDDVLGGFLDLPHALEITDGGSDVFDADTEQRRHRHRQELRQLLQRLDLRQLALLEAVERGARDPEPARDLVGAEPRSQAKGLQAVADIVEANGHEWNVTISSVVMAGLDPAIHVLSREGKMWMPGHRRQVYAVCASLTALPGHDGNTHDACAASARILFAASSVAMTMFW